MPRQQFGRVTIDSAAREARVDGTAVALGSRAFDVLIALVERRDRVVGKAELMDIVWPGLVVEDNNLQVQVSALRKALGPDAIATVAGRGYRFTLQPGLPGAAPEMEPDGADGNQADEGATESPLIILVLPLANATGEPAKDYVADGLTVAITGDLSRIRGAVVVPPHTAAALHGRQLAEEKLIRASRARFILRGTVVMNGAQIRVSLRLTHTASGTQLWSDTLGGQLTDMFALQDRITGRIRASMGPHMVLAAARDLARRPRAAAVADLMLRLDALLLQPPSLERELQAEALCLQVLAREPEHPSALALLSATRFLLAHNYGDQRGLDLADLRRHVAEAAVIARAALRADPDQSIPHLVLSRDALMAGDYESAKRELEKALELDPWSEHVLNNLAVLYRDLGETQQSYDLYRQALQLPTYLQPDFEYLGLMVTARRLGRHEESIHWGLKAVQALPNWASVHGELAVSYALHGNETAARASASRALQLDPEYRYGLPWLIWPGREDAFHAHVDQELIPAAMKAGLPTAAMFAGGAAPNPNIKRN
jgi:TolB-like protein/tetratricopeptide (TPR) repeat protein